MSGAQVPWTIEKNYEPKKTQQQSQWKFYNELLLAYLQNSTVCLVSRETIQATNYRRKLNFRDEIKFPPDVVARARQKMFFI